jgi:hypothetical protein
MESHGAGALDVASGLFEYGLRQYLNHYAPQIAA